MQNNLAFMRKIYLFFLFLVVFAVACKKQNDAHSVKAEWKVGSNLQY
jgi:hypothetical protein